MFSYLVDTGHNNYTESFHEYLQHMMIKKTKQCMTHSLMDHSISVSDRYRAGLSSDYVIRYQLL
jgi:hypothetical protein